MQGNVHDTPAASRLTGHASDDSPIRLSVVVPAFNEAEAIRSGSLKEIASWKRAQPFPVEIIVVDDGSSDGTSQAAAADADRVVRIEHAGKGRALIAGIRAAAGELVLLTDMDQATPIGNANKLLHALKQGSFDIVLGSRGLARPSASLSRRAASFGHWAFRKLLIRLPVVDTQCGFKLARRASLLDILDHLLLYNSSGEPARNQSFVNSGFDVEVLVVAHLLGYKTCEVPVSWCANRESRLALGIEAACGIRDLLRISMKNYRKEWSNQGAGFPAPETRDDGLADITVIIVVRSGQADVTAVDAARKLDYPADRIEYVLVRGTQASVQRNAGSKASRGEWLYFLDDDSLPDAANLCLAMRHMANPEVIVIGGPSVFPPGAPLRERLFAAVQTSWLAFGPSRARYTPLGAVRGTSEKELIGCNLLVRRRTIMEIGGFDEGMFPNEENALLERLQRHSGQLLYDPRFIVHRRARRTLGAFVRMLLFYGWGRAQHVRRQPTMGSALNLVPCLFCLYLLALVPILAGPLDKSIRWFALAPLAMYLLAVVSQTLISIRTAGVVCALLAMPLLAVTHVAYGLGFLSGIFRPTERAATRKCLDVQLERVS